MKDDVPDVSESLVFSRRGGEVSVHLRVVRRVGSGRVLELRIEDWARSEFVVEMSG